MANTCCCSQTAQVVGNSTLITLWSPCGALSTHLFLTFHETHADSRPLSRHAPSSLSIAAIQGGIIAGGFVMVLLLLAFFMLKRRLAFRQFGHSRRDAELILGAPAHSQRRGPGDRHGVLGISDPARTYTHAEQAFAFSKLAQELAQTEAPLRQPDVALPSDPKHPHGTFNIRLDGIKGLVAKQDVVAGSLPEKGHLVTEGALFEERKCESLSAYDAQSFAHSRAQLDIQPSPMSPSLDHATLM
jgi:hypothetical protein